MSAQLMTNPFFRFFTFSGTLEGMSGGYMETKVPGTDTNKATYDGIDGLTPLPNPIYFDADGSPIDSGGNKTGIYGSGTYLLKLYNAAGTFINEITGVAGEGGDLSVCLYVDGSNTPLAAIDWNGQNLTDVADFTAATGDFSGAVAIDGTLTNAVRAIGTNGSLSANVDDIELISTSAIGDINIENQGTGDVNIDAQCGNLRLTATSGDATIVPSGDVGLKTAAPVGDIGFGATNQVYISGDSINAQGEINGNSELKINAKGYDNGVAQFRDLRIMDGKGGLVAIFDGSNASLGIGDTPVKLLDVFGEARIQGVLTNENRDIGTIGSLGKVSADIKLSHTDTGDIIIKHNGTGDIDIDSNCGSVNILPTGGNANITVASSDTINLQSADGDISLTTTGSGDVNIESGTGELNLTGAKGIVVITTHTPSSASDTGTAGTIAWDANYIYVCTATNTWKRVAIATW